jgi:hypothetical protein
VVGRTPGRRRGPHSGRDTVPKRPKKLSTSQFAAGQDDSDIGGQRHVVQETDKIKDQIDTQRGRLERDLNEIEHRVKKVVNWREWFERNPAGVLGAAAAGGFVLSFLTRRSSDASRVNRYADLDRGSSSAAPGQPKSPSKTSSQMSRMADTLDNTVAALLGVASTKVRDFVAEVVPNFREEYREVEAKRESGVTRPGDKSQMSAD